MGNALVGGIVRTRLNPGHAFQGTHGLFALSAVYRDFKPRPVQKDPDILPGALQAACQPETGQRFFLLVGSRGDPKCYPGHVRPPLRLNIPRGAPFSGDRGSTAPDFEVERPPLGR